MLWTARQGLITRRSEVQILPPPLKALVGALILGSLPGLFPWRNYYLSTPPFCWGRPSRVLRRLRRTGNVHVAERPDPAPDADHVLVRTHAAGVGIWGVGFLSSAIGQVAPPGIPGGDAPMPSC